VHGSFDLHGSSLSKASFDTRLQHLFCGIKQTTTAVEMVHLKITDCIRSALGFPPNMANIPGSLLCDQSLTGRAHARLSLPNTIKLTATFRRVQHFLAPPGLEVRFPLWVVWIGVRFNLEMPFYWRIRLIKQDMLFLRSIFAFLCGGKYPMSSPSGFKVFVLNPSGSLIRMPSYRSPP
jgi:hypothetical protein